VIALREAAAAKATVTDATDLTASVSPWLQADHDNLTGKVLRLPDRVDIDTPVQEQLIVELYSK
jgi:small subunit ribosomal protein S4